MTKRSVRPARLSDLNAISALAQESFTEIFDACALPIDHPLRGHVLGSTRQLWERTLSTQGENADSGHTFLALEGESPVGLISTIAAPAQFLEIGQAKEIPAGVEVTTLYVHRSFRRSGHGSRLLAAIVDTLQPASLRMWLAPEDTLMLRFLQGSGFLPAGLKRSFMFDEALQVRRDEHLWWALRS